MIEYLGDLEYILFEKSKNEQLDFDSAQDTRTFQLARKLIDELVPGKRKKTIICDFCTLNLDLNLIYFKIFSSIWSIKKGSTAQLNFFLTS